MKKITFLFSMVMTFAFLGTLQAKDITIYVHADQQPNIHFWNVSNESTEWPGQAMTSTISVKNLQGEDIMFYYKTFANLSDDAAISFLFNFNGDADKTADINGITEDHYYIFKGNHEYEDITSQFKNVADAEIGAVQLPGNYCNWTGDNAPMTLTEEKTYTITPDLSGVTDDFITFKLLVNSGSNWYWLGWNDVKVDAPDGWAQEAAADGNIQLNIGAIGTKQFTITAVFGGGDNASANWTLKIDADADAIIEKAQLPGNFNGWNGDNAVFTKKEGNTYTYSLDLSEVSDPTVTFKLLVNNHHWLGYYDLVAVNAPEGWAEEAASDGNIQLNLTAANTKKFIVTAIWAGGKIASSGWSLKIEAEGTTGICTLTDSKNADAPVYDLIGHKVSQPTKGLYIVDGRKVIVK